MEKGLSGVESSGETDGGTGARVFGTLLTWLNDHTSDVLFVGTCNDIRKVPSAFSRAERFDATFFFDVPSRAERRQIWEIYLTMFKCSASDDEVAGYVALSSGWTGAEIKACCRLAAVLGISIEESSSNIVPVAKSDKDNLESLREWAENRCLATDKPGLYKHMQKAATKVKPKLPSTPRKVQR